MAVQVSQLFHFPVKSLKGSKLESMSIDEFGPQWDRRFMLVEKTGRFVTQRQSPKMGQISTHVNEGTLVLTFAEDQRAVNLKDLNTIDQYMDVRVWNDEVRARLITSEVNTWLSNILNRDVFLCYMGDDTHRQVDLEFSQAGDRASFSDGFPFLIISEASVDFLSEKLGRHLEAERFRANIVVSGCEAFEEDQWKKIKIKGIEFELVKPCSRCVIPTLDLNTSQKQPDVMQVMLKHRKQGKHVMMGQNAIHRGLGVIKVGDVVELIN
ncbi:MAG: MOSC domain-containing protein [Bermanella sp.]